MDNFNPILTNWIRPIPGFPGYTVSDAGTVSSYFKRVGRKWIIAKRPQRILSPYTIPYPFVILSRNGKLYNRRIHQLVMEAFVGPRPDGMEVCHNDSDPTNNRVTNLRYDTRAGNLADAVALGRMGGMMPNDQAEQVRISFADGAHIDDLAQKHGVVRQTILNIIHGKSNPGASGPIVSERIKTQFKVKRSGSSGYRGVTWDKRKGAWRAQISGGVRKTIHLGKFKVEVDAARAYDIAARERYGRRARLNFPDEK